MPVEKALTLSTKHLPLWETYERDTTEGELLFTKDAFGTKVVPQYYKFGVLIKITFLKYTISIDQATPDWFSPILRYAIRHRCGWIHFCKGSPEHNEFLVYHSLEDDEPTTEEFPQITPEPISIEEDDALKATVEFQHPRNLL